MFTGIAVVVEGVVLAFSFCGELSSRAVVAVPGWFVGEDITSILVWDRDVEGKVLSKVAAAVPS